MTEVPSGDNCAVVTV